MKIIDLPAPPSFTFIPFHKNDLVWVSQYQMPFVFAPDVFQNVDGSWSIPCDLFRIVDVYFTETGQVWGLSITDKNNIIMGIRIEDVIQNYTKLLSDLNTIRKANIIKKMYHKYYTIRKIMANRIKRKYIQHYWNPSNPNMIKRLEGDFHKLTSM